MKTVLRIFNIILIALSAVAISFIVFTPLLEMNVNYTVQTTDLENVFKGKLGEGEDSISEEELHDIIVTETHGDGIKFSLSLKLEREGLKKMRDGTNDERLNALKDEVFKPVIQQVIDNEEIKGVVNSLAKTMAKKMAKKTLKEQIRDNLLSEDDKANENFFNEIGLTDEFLDQQTETIYNALTGNGGEEKATVDGVADAIISVLENTMDVFVQAAASNPEYAEYGVDGSQYKSDEEIESLRKDIKDSLEKMLVDNNLAETTEDPETKEKVTTILSVDEALAMIIEQMMNQGGSGDSSSSGSSEPEPEPEPSIILRHYENTSTSTSQSKEEKKVDENKKTLSEVITEAAWKTINDNVFKDENTKATIADALSYTGKYGVIAEYVFMGMWAVLAIFAFIKIFAKKKPYVYMGFFWWLAIVIFGLIELVFGAMLFVRPIIEAIKGVVSLPEALLSLDFSLYSCFSICWICNTVLFFFSIAYAIIGHKVKVNYKVEKRAAKAAAAN
ncbi:MAG: DUF308 domain-containing protein [Bacilli bacterium]|nr:DUF308 domain-containing protein [Bacilli bacterium]